MKLKEMKPEIEANQINRPRIVSKAEWLIARKELLTREKEMTRLRDEVSRHRRGLPWVKIDKEYVFDGPDGKERLADRFRRAKPIDRLSLHVRSGMGRGLQKLLVPGRSF
jgi:predicted dithiol-disulfide oxidoreductase (DUF899 family)